MPFIQIDVNEIIENKRKNDAEFKQAWDDSRKEYRTIGEVVNLKKEGRSGV